ncbi:MAG: hypothetical protein OSJ45_05780 [Lachnospiraceae bacterium]|nr:hypothetical protein [Lachnospiraceae bacterium]
MAYTVRTQMYEITDCTLDNIKEFTNIMLNGEDEKEFIVLYAPEEINGISFLQAAVHNGTVTFQAGVKIDGRPEVMEKKVSNRRCYRYLRDYFLEGVTPDLSGFTLMKRM